MRPQEEAEVLALLECGRREFLESLGGLAEDKAAEAPGSGRWSALECAEHVVLAEEYMLSLFAEARLLESIVGSAEREARIPVFGVSRARKMEAPEPARPTGRFGTLTQALGAFATARARTVRAIQESGEDLRLKTAVHPVVGPVNCYELLLIMAVHPRRHAMQIAEIRAALSA